MLQVAAYGRLGADPRLTNSGKRMAIATIAVAITDHDAPPLWMGVMAFGKFADDLMRCQKGDMISASGRIQRNVWTKGNGEKQEQLQIVADSLFSSRSARAHAGRRRKENRSENRSSVEPQLNDDLEF